MDENKKVSCQSSVCCGYSNNSFWLRHGGDHSMTADLSYVPWCNVSLDTDDTTDSFGGSGSCAAPDAQINFSGKLADKWTYAFNLDSSEVKESGLGAAAVAGYWGDVASSVLLTGDLGGGLSLSW